MSKSTGGDSKNTLYCSFCGKSQHEVRKLIAGPTVFITLLIDEVVVDRPPLDDDDDDGDGKGNDKESDRD